MTNFIETLLQISITMAAVIGLLLLLVPVWQKRYSAKWRKLIWLIIAVRLLVPFSIELPTAPVQMNVDMHEAVVLSTQPVYTVQNTPMPATPNKIDTPSDIVVNTTVNTTTPTVTIEKGILLDRGTVLFAIWLLGLLAFTIYHIVQYRRFYGKIMASVKPLEDSDELLERAGADMGLQRYPAVLLSGNVHSPMLIGFRAPTIVLQYKLYGENELVMILRHELTHYKHYDLWYKLILLCANALHWFNPLVWMMNRQAGRDVEQVCDDYVVTGQDMDYRKAYSMTILNTMASQKGVALSTHLSKDAQNTKKRFAGILQPKTYKKGIAVFAAVLILAVGISGCLQIGKVDEGVALYNKVAEYLPENAIHEPEVYEVQGVDDEASDYITYMWKEEPYEVTKEEVYSRMTIGSTEVGEDGKLHYYHYKRALHVLVKKNSSNIIGVVYDRDERDMVPPTKQPEIARNQEVREAYVQSIVKNLCGIEDMTFKEGYVETDKDGNAVDGYYYHGTIADEKQYQVHLNYQYGYLMELYHFPNSALDDTYVEETFMLEGMEETVELAVNRQEGYYAMYTDYSIFHRVPQERTVEGAFLDRYVRRVEPNLVQCYIQVGYEPNMTIGEWLDEVETDRDYVQFRPQTNPLTLYEGLEWVPTGNDKVFPNVPNRQWREYITISDAYNVCYLTPYRDGVMIVQYSHPFGAEDFEGMGSRMAQMIDTLVLATE
jgi:beta-lactamase regulating signal transducer with metallopeptidase domain